ncbi:MAG: hypothetical protein ACKOSQ_05800 [Planctomycetaceae bacterium]
MNDLLVSILIIVGFYGAIIAAAWLAYLIFSWIGNRLPGRKPPTHAAGSSLPPAPLWAIDPCAASYRRALREWGTTIVATGEEADRYVSELLFTIHPAVAGVSEVLTASGAALFTPGLRCMIVIDSGRITALDREKQRGIRLEAEQKGEYLRARLEGATLRIHLHQQTDPDEDPADRPGYSERLFSIDLHAEAGLQVVPAGWPGGMVLLPADPR